MGDIESFAKATGGIAGNGDVENSYNYGNITLEEENDSSDITTYIGGITSIGNVTGSINIGNYDDKDLDVNGVNFNNKYVIKTNSVINNAVSSIKDIKNNNNEIDNKFGTKVDDFNVLDVLSVINKNNCYKINSNGDILFKD